MATRTKAAPKGDDVRSYGDLGRVRMPAEASDELFDAELGALDAQVLPGALQGLLTELGAADDDAKVTVNRLENVGGVKKTVWLFDCSPAEFRLQDVQEFYGAGDYQVIVFGKASNSNHRIAHANKRITIGAPRGGVKPTTTPPAAAAGADSTALAKAMAEALAGPLGVMANMVQALAQRGGGSRAEMLEEIKQIFEITRAAPPPAAAAAPDLVAQLTHAKALAGLFAGMGGKELDEESGPWAVLLEAAKNLAPVGNALAEKIALGGARPVRALSAPAAAAETPAPAPATTNDDKDNATMNAGIKLQLLMLLNAARADVDTITYATLIAEQAPDPVIAMLERADWLDELCKLEPAFVDHKPWAQRCRDEVLQLIAPEPDANVASVKTEPPVAGANITNEQK